jgi:hypothetical protein
VEQSPVVAGTGALGYSGDGVAGGAANASLYHPFAVAVDSTGIVYIPDQGDCVVRKVDTAKTITTVAGIAAPMDTRATAAKVLPRNCTHLGIPRR